jgi:hypothetical protein
MDEFLEGWHDRCEIDETDGPLVREVKTSMSLALPLPAGEEDELG